MGHLFLDSLSRKGVSLLYPFYGRKMKGWIKVGGGEEALFQALLIFLILWKAF
jgi:hypothetical protein